MAKHILRIVVTLLILSTLGYAVWLYFLNPNNDEYVALQIKEIIVDEDKDESLSKNLNTLLSRNYYGSTASQHVFVESNAQQQEIVRIRKIVFGLENNSEIVTYYGEIAEDLTVAQINDLRLKELSVKAINDNLFTVLNSYFTYAQFVENSSSDDLKAVRTLFKDYQKEYNKMNDLVKTIINWQKNGSDTTTVNGQTTNYYRNLVTNLKTYYTSFVNLNLGLKEYVVKRAFDNNLVYDLNAILNDATLYSTLNFVNTLSYEENAFTGETIPASVRTTNKKLYDAALIRFALKTNIESAAQEDRFNFILNYNTLYKDYNEILFNTNTTTGPEFSIYFKTNAQKQGIVSGVAGEIVNIQEEFISTVQNVLSFLGFVYAEEV